MQVRVMRLACIVVVPAELSMTSRTWETEDRHVQLGDLLHLLLIASLLPSIDETHCHFAAL